MATSDLFQDLPDSPDAAGTQQESVPTTDLEVVPTTPTLAKEDAAARPQPPEPNAPVASAVPVKEYLSALERADLAHCEMVIATVFQSCFDQGRAIRKVRDQRLYREHFNNIEQYVEERWDLKRSYLYQLIDATNVYDNLQGVAAILPVNEYQARQLAGLSKDEQRQVWKHVVANAGATPITAKMIKAAVKELVEPAQPDLPEAEDDAGTGDVISLFDLPKKTINVLLVTDIVSDNPAVAADKLKEILSQTTLALAEDCHLLVVSRCPDARALFTVAEDYDFDLGTPLVCVFQSARRAISWSFASSTTEILHFRRGSAAIKEKLDNVVEYPAGKTREDADLPFEVADLLVRATTVAGQVVATAGSVKTLQLACQNLNRKFVSVRPDEADEADGASDAQQLEQAA